MAWSRKRWIATAVCVVLLLLVPVAGWYIATKDKESDAAPEPEQHGDIALPREGASSIQMTASVCVNALPLLNDCPVVTAWQNGAFNTTGERWNGTLVADWKQELTLGDNRLTIDVVKDGAVVAEGKGQGSAYIQLRDLPSGTYVVVIHPEMAVGVLGSQKVDWSVSIT